MDEQQEFRQETARSGLEAYEEWKRSGTPLTPEALSNLASAARWWYVESLDQADVTVGEC